MTNFIVQHFNAVPTDFTRFAIETMREETTVWIYPQSSLASHHYILNYIQELLFHRLIDYQNHFEVVQLDKEFPSEIQKIRKIQQTFRITQHIEILKINPDLSKRFEYDSIGESGTQSVLGFILFLNNSDGKIEFSPLDKEIEAEEAKLIIYPYSFTHRTKILAPEESPMWIIRGTIEKYFGIIPQEF